MVPLGGRVGIFVAAVLMSGCATHRPQTIAERFVHHDPARTAGTPTADEAKQDAALQASLDRQMAKVRELIAAPRPPRAQDAVNIEQSDAGLAAARAALAAAPSAEHHRGVAEAYARLHVLDAAY